MRRVHLVSSTPPSIPHKTASTPLKQTPTDPMSTLTHAADLWRKLSIFIVIPALCMASVNAWRLWSEHWEHKAHEPPIEERTEYPYQNIRTKNFFWGDGDKVCYPASFLKRGLCESAGMADSVAMEW